MLQLIGQLFILTSGPTDHDTLFNIIFYNLYCAQKIEGQKCRHLKRGMAKSFTISR